MYWNCVTVSVVSASIGWIVTLDVLKSKRKDEMEFIEKLNSNIRCIEIQVCP